MKTISVRGFTPEVSEKCFIADSATLIGDLQIGAESSIWYQVVIRGDVAPIRIGKQVNVQDGTVIHGTYQKFGTTLHDRVTIGHLAMLHGCEIGEATLIGMGSIVMDGVKMANIALLELAV